MVSRLSREFALKTEAERRAAYADMLLSPVMHTDCTNGRENGKGCQIYVCATPDGKALYFAREKKGMKGERTRSLKITRGSLYTIMTGPFIIMERIIRNALPMCCAI